MVAGDDGQAGPRRFAVVSSTEERYSIWPAGRDTPDGWTRTGFEAARQDCLDHIAKVWTDMRPRSIRHRDDAASRG